MSKQDDSSSPPAAADDGRDPVIEFYKKDVDRTLLRENLKLTVEERFQRFEAFMRRIQALPESRAAYSL
jgi:hypothetical protein